MQYANNFIKTYISKHIMTSHLSIDRLLNALRAAGEATRLRLLVLLLDGELNVKDLTRILGQSQPRISRHLKVLTDAELIERFQEGSWVYFRLSENKDIAALIRKILDDIDMDDPALVRDRMRAHAVKKERADAAQTYFRDHAAEWDHIRSLYVPETAVEAAMLELLGEDSFDVFVDLGTGTGRILELFAERIQRGIGIDINHDMLSYARSNLEGAGHNHCQVRFGDLFHLSLEDKSADVVVFHQVLHFLTDPALAIAEAQRILKPNGRLLIVDFSSHTLEFLRDIYAHQRLGFDQEQIKGWIESCGLHLGKQKDLKPSVDADSDQLTVSLWLAHNAPHPGALSKTDVQNDNYIRDLARSL